MTAISRAALIRGCFAPEPARPRPPWARPEPEFVAHCTGCADCIEACPEDILVLRRGRTPEVDFSRGACTFCGACVEACAPGALGRGSEPSRPWRLTAWIDGSCLNRSGVLCRACEEHCEAGAIAFPPRPAGRSGPDLDAAACTGCGACLSVCPVAAVSIVERGGA